MVQVTTRGSQPNEIGKFISRFDSKKDTKPTASNSREPSEGISLFLRKGSVGAGRMSCRSSLTREDPEKNSNDSNQKY
jgi:hypothetical protein